MNCPGRSAAVEEKKKLLKLKLLSEITRNESLIVEVTNGVTNPSLHKKNILLVMALPTQ